MSRRPLTVATTCLLGLVGLWGGVACNSSATPSGDEAPLTQCWSEASWSPPRALEPEPRDHRSTHILELTLLCSEQNDMDACFAAARRHYAGIEAEQDVDLARELFRQACENDRCRLACDEGDKRACYYLGSNTYLGYGTAADPDRGLRLMTEACSPPTPAWCETLWSHHAFVTEQESCRAYLDCAEGRPPAGTTVQVTFSDTGEQSLAVEAPSPEAERCARSAANAMALPIWSPEFSLTFKR